MDSTALLPLLQRPAEAWAAWLQDGLGASPAIDVALHVFGAAAAVTAVRALGASRMAAWGAGLFVAAHPAAFSAVPFGARAILAGNAAALVAITGAALGGKRAALWLFVAIPALLSAQPAVVALGFAPLLLWLLRRPASEAPASTTSTRDVAASCAVGLAAAAVAWASSRAPLAVPQLGAALLGGGGALIPVMPQPDTWAMAAPADAIPAPIPALVRVLQLAGVLAVGALWFRSTRVGAALFTSALIAAAFAPLESANLNDRAVLAAVPAAAILGAFFLDAVHASCKRPWTAREIAAGFAVAAATLGGIAAKRVLMIQKTDYIALARERALGSPVLREAYGQWLGGRARDASATAGEATALRREALEEFDAAALAARDSARRFRNRLLAADLAPLVETPDAVRARASALVGDATNNEEKAAAVLARAKALRALGDGDAAFHVLEAAAADPALQIDVALVREYLKHAVADVTSRMAAAKSRPSDGAPAALADALEKRCAETAAWRSDPRLRAAALAASGRLAVARARPVDAQKILREAKELDPGCAEAYLGAADAYLSLGVLTGAATELQAGIAATAPNPPAELLVSLAGVRLQLGSDPAQVVKLLEAARAVDPTFPRWKRARAAALVALAEERLRKGNLAEADAAAQTACDDAPDLAQAHETLGRVREEQKKFSDSLASFEKAFSLEPNETRRELYAGALKRSALEMLLRGDRPAALHRFLQIRDLHCSSVDLGTGADMLEAECTRELAAAGAAIKAKRFDEAKAALTRALRYSPDDPAALFALGGVHGELGDDAAAVDSWKRAREEALRRGADLSKSALLPNLANAERRLMRFGDARLHAQEYRALGDGPYRVQMEALVEVLDLLEKKK